MLDSLIPQRQTWREELRLKHWQFILQLTRLAAGTHQWARIFRKNWLILAASFLFGTLIGLLPLVK